MHLLLALSGTGVCYKWTQTANDFSLLFETRKWVLLSGSF